MQKYPETLLYSDFLKVLLDFQLQEHEKFLQKFTEIFKQIDTTRHGILNEAQFRFLIQAMNEACNERIALHHDQQANSWATAGGANSVEISQDDLNDNVAIPNLQLIGGGDDEIAYLLQ